MRTRLSGWFLAWICISFLSCQKELSKENGTIPIKGNFYATVDGIQWDADSLQFIFESNGEVSINGLSKAGEQISMYVPTFKTGTYTLNTNSDSYAYYTNILVVPPVGYLSNSGSAGGTITISAIDTANHLLSGYFSFTLVDPVGNMSKVVTGGVMNMVPYSGTILVVNPPPPPNSTDTLNAKIDGVPFTGLRIMTDINPVFPDQLLIVGSNTDATQRLEIIMPKDVTPGTYGLDYDGNTYIGIYFPPIAETLISQANGSLTIISNDTVNKRISGTFQFIATPVFNGTPAQITDGYFNVNY